MGKTRTLTPGRTINPEATEALLADIRNFPKTDEGWHRFPDKGWLQQQGAKYGKTDAWGSMTLKGLEAKGRIQVVREGRAVRGAILLDTVQPTPQAATPTAAEPQPEQETQPEQGSGASLNDRLVALLQRSADEHGKVRMSTDEMRRRLNVPIHDVIKELYNVKKAGNLAFRETRSGKSMNLLAFRLQGSLLPRTAPVDSALAPWSICPDCYWDRRYHRKGEDRTTLICPEPPKTGSPRAVEAAKAKPVGSPVRSRQHGSGGHRAPERTERPSPVTTYYECHELVDDPNGGPVQVPCASRFQDPIGLRMHKDAKHSGEPAPQNAKPAPGQQVLPVPAPEPQPTDSAQAVTAAASGDAVVPVPGMPGTNYVRMDWAQYPLLTEVARVYHARMRALDILREAGDTQVPEEFIRGPVGQAGTGPRIADEITRLLAALGYEGAIDGDKA